MVLKLESKRCAGLASSIYRYRSKFKLFFPHTRSLIGEPFPSPLEHISHVPPRLKGFTFRVHDFCYSGVRFNDQQDKVKPAHICITHQLHLTWSKRKRFNVFKTVTLTRSCKEIVFPFCVRVALTPIPSYPPCPWDSVGHYAHARYMGQRTQCHIFVQFGIHGSSFCIIQ